MHSTPQQAQQTKRTDTAASVTRRNVLMSVSVPSSGGTAEGGGERGIRRSTRVVVKKNKELTARAWESSAWHGA